MSLLVRPSRGVRAYALVLAFCVTVAAGACSSAAGGAGGPTTAPAPTSALAPRSPAGTAATSALASPTTTMSTGTTVADPVVKPGSGPSGEVLRSEPLALATGVRAWRVWYRSIDVAGKPSVVSGIVVAPATAATDGALPVVAFAHPTTGLADACAPSLALAGRSPTPDQSSVLLAKALAPLAASRNWVLAMTDYEGLGTPGVHPFLVADAAARSVLDSVRAAQRLETTGATADSPVVLWGYSQGGGAVISSAELASTYAPELRLQGVAAGAPASELTALTRNVLTSDADRAYVFLTAAGFAAAYPDLALPEVFTPAGLSLVQRATEVCAGEFGRLVRTAGPLADLVKVDPTTIAAFAAVLEENTPGRRPVNVPVFIAQGDADTLVVPAATEALRARLCSQGGRQVERRVYPGGSHGTTAILSLTDSTTWVAERLTGTAPGSGC